MTLKQIAEEAGVSISTVSRVVNQQNTHAASPEVQKRIWEIVRKTGYTPSESAQALRSSKKKAPTLSVACLFARNSVSVSDNLFFNGIEQSFEKEMLASNFSVKCLFTDLDLKNNDIQTYLLGQKISGIIIIGRHNLDLVYRLRSSFKNIVYAGMMLPPSKKYDSVICDSYQIGQAATEYLLKLGHERIAYIGNMENESRFQGYKNKLTDNGIPIEDRFCINCDLSMDGGYTGAKKLLESEPPTAIFCMNDDIAIGAMSALKEKGLQIPKDISIIGVDDTPGSRYTRPQLTTVHTPMEELGSISAKVLIDRIKNGHTIDISVSLPFYIVERDSCASLMTKSNGAF